MKIEIYHGRDNYLYLEGDISSRTMDIFRSWINNRLIDINNMEFKEAEGELVFNSKEEEDEFGRLVRYQIIIRKIKGIHINNRFKDSKRRRWVKVKFKIDYNKVVIYASNIFLRRYFEIILDVEEADIELLKVLVGDRE